MCSIHFPSIPRTCRSAKPRRRRGCSRRSLRSARLDRSNRQRIHFQTTMTTNHNDDAARRAYWAEQMELGYAMVQELIAFPVSECGEGFASIPDAAAAANVEMLFS